MNESFAETFLKATKPMRLAAACALGVLALFLVAKTIDAFNQIGHTTPYMNSITVEGSGNAAAIPNIAQITFSVDESAVTVADAQAAATKKTNDALAAVKNLGIDDKDVKTVGYNVSPKYESAPCYSGYCPNSQPKITGYQVMQSVQVKVRDTAKAGDVLQALGTLEVQNISGPNFTVDEDEDMKSEARAEAIENAKSKAKALADKLGVHLGKVVSFYENQGGYPMYGYGGDMMKAESAMAVPAPSLPTGEQETSVSVSITYEIN
jgi:uncharacterized protein